MLNIIKFLPGSILNRLRGTGSMFYIGKLNINGNILYGLYFYILTIVLSFIFGYSWYWSILVLALYIIGEASAWGKWIGYLTEPTMDIKYSYNNPDGRSFPFIHYIANSIINQEKNYKAYCILALALRGIYWWLPLYTLLGWLFGQLLVGAILGLVTGILFPVGAILATKYNFVFKYEKIKYECTENWSRQEIFNGTFQTITLYGLIIYALIMKTIVG